MISNSLDIDFIDGDIHGRSCKKYTQYSSHVILLTRNTRHRGQRDYKYARIDLGASGVQYVAAELWNNLSQEE